MRAGDHQHAVGVRRAGDKHLAAGQPVAVPILCRQRGHRETVGAGIRLGNGEAQFFRAADGRIDEALDLRGRALADDRHAREAGQEQHGQHQSGLGQGFHQRNEFHLATAAAAQFVGDGDAKQAVFAQRFPGFLREAVVIDALAHVCPAKALAHAAGGLADVTHALGHAGLSEFNFGCCTHCLFSSCHRSGMTRLR